MLWLAWLLTFSTAPPPAPPQSPRFDTALSTPQLFASHCAPCHGREGLGNGRRMKHGVGARNLTAASWQDAYTDAQILESIRDGIPGSKMRGFGREASQAQLKALVVYIRGLRTPPPAR